MEIAAHIMELAFSSTDLLKEHECEELSTKDLGQFWLGYIGMLGHPQMNVVWKWVPGLNCQNPFVTKVAGTWRGKSLSLYNLTKGIQDPLLYNPLRLLDTFASKIAKICNF